MRGLSRRDREWCSILTRTTDRFRSGSAPTNPRDGLLCYAVLILCVSCTLDGSTRISAKFDLDPECREGTTDCQALLRTLDLAMGGSDTIRRDWSYADFRGCNIGARRIADLSFVFDGATFSGANMQNAIFSRISMRGANFGGANLRAALLVASDLSAARFVGADLVGASLHAATIDKTNFRGADLRHVDLTFSKGRFPNFANAMLVGALFHDAELFKPKLDGAVTDPDP